VLCLKKQPQQRAGGVCEYDRISINTATNLGGFMGRETLEAMALECVTSEDYYDLLDCVDQTTDSGL